VSTTAHVATSVAKIKRLSLFERYLSLWVAVCMLAGVLLGRAAPVSVDALRKLQFGQGSQVNVPMAVLIWLMIVPMMMKVDFSALRRVGRRPRGLLVTLGVNWLVKPFSTPSRPTTSRAASCMWR
jgi:ACR3 family arsenite transporter